MNARGQSIRIGIRGRLLAFIGIAIILILAMVFIAQRESRRVAEDFERRLSHYHLVHRMRTILVTLRSEGERYLREPFSVEVGNLYGLAASLKSLDGEIETLAQYSQEAEFEVRATGYGLDACLPLIEKAFALRASGRSDYYADFARGDRIAGFVEGYLSKLLTILMREGEQSFSAGARKSKAINETILFGIVAAGIFLLAYVYIVANSITKPIRKLARQSEKLAHGDLDVEPLVVKSRDEVGILAESFHAMSANIRAYIKGLEDKAELEKKLHEEETSLLSMGKALREAQFMNLQDQMRPHFLFNALNSIARNALLEGAGTTERLTISLAKLLRATMKEGGPYITLGEEIDIVREYLGFQKVRFKDRFDWEIRFDPSMEGIRVPRFLLQPLVENAVRHGIEPKEGKADILISLRQRSDSLQMSVVDTGIGISPADLDSLRKKIAQSMSEARADPATSASIPSGTTDRLGGGFGIGVGNVATRLYLLYGAEGSLRIHSRSGKGTLVRLSLPVTGDRK